MGQLSLKLNCPFRPSDRRWCWTWKISLKGRPSRGRSVRLIGAKFCRFAPLWTVRQLALSLGGLAFPRPNRLVGRTGLARPEGVPLEKPVQKFVTGRTGARTGASDSLTGGRSAIPEQVRLGATRRSGRLLGVSSIPALRARPFCKRQRWLDQASASAPDENLDRSPRFPAPCRPSRN